MVAPSAPLQAMHASREDDSSSATPRASPEEPPKPMPSSHQFRHTPRQTLSWESADDVSVPNAPSPYSEPPASLFSEDERPTTSRKSRRGGPPLSEVRMHQNLVQTDTYDSDEPSLEEQIMQITNSVPTPMLNIPTPTSVRSHSSVLPAILQLKKDLLQSHQTVFLLQQENKALQEQCDKLNLEHQTQLTALRNAESSLQSSVQRLTDEKKTLVDEKEHLVTRVKSLEESHAQIESKTQADVNSLRQQLESVQGELSASASTIESLENQRQKLENDLLASRVSSEGASSTHAALKDQIVTLESQIKDLRAKLKVTASESQAKVKAIQEELAASKQRSEEEKKARQLEIDRLKAVLREKEMSVKNDSDGLASRVTELQSKLAELEKSYKDSSSKNSVLRAEKMALRKEVTQLQKQIKEMRKQQRLGVSTSSVSCQTEAVERVSFGVQTDRTRELPVAIDTPSVISIPGNSITDRLGRIRDAAEKAAFFQEYRRELVRIKSDHEAELRRLEKEHDESLRRVLNEAKSEMNSRTKDCKRALRAEYEAKIAELERRHAGELEMTKQEMEKNSSVTREAMEAAMSEVSLTQQELERECMKRQELEQTVQALNRKLDDEKRMRSEFDMTTLRRDWEKETEILLSSIRNECNAAFQKRHSAPAMADRYTPAPRKMSPRSVAFSEDLTMDQDIQNLAVTQYFERPQQMAENWTLGMRGVPLNSELDRALDETEALVRSLVENELKV